MENGPRWWFLTIIWKSIHKIQFKLVVYTCWVSVQKLFTFGQCWPNFVPLMAKNHLKLVKMMVSNRFLKKDSHNPIQTWRVHLLGECSEIICFLITLAKFWPSSGTKWLKLVVSDYYLKKYSRNSIQTWCVHLLAECWEIICFWSMLAKFWAL